MELRASELIKEARRIEGLSQAKFAKKHRISIDKIKNWEGERNRVPADDVFRLFREIPSLIEPLIKYVGK